MEKKSVFLLTENDINAKTIEIIQSSKDSVVIPITYKTVKLLKEKNIKFEIFDELLSSKDYESIDNTIYKIGRTWWENDDLKQIFDYDGVNIAQMMESELIVSLLKFGHRICLVKKILEHLKPNTVYVSDSKKSISKIPNLFVNELKFEIKSFPVENEEKNFRNDDFTVGFDFIGKNFDITISRKNFFKIKKYYEAYWKNIYKISSKQKKHKNGEKILLLDFNLITNKSTVEALSNSEFEILLANTRRPIIWNKESLKIAKKINFKNINLKYNTEYIHPKTNMIMNNFERFIDSNEYFKKIFSVYQTSFWSIFKDDFIEFCKKRFSEILFLIDSLNQLLDDEKIKLLITLDDSMQIGRTATVLCNKKNIPTLLSLNTDINIFQDGKRDWEVFTLNKIFAKKFAIYGKLAEKLCLEHHIDPKKLVITGNPRYDELFKKNDVSNKDNILISLSGIASTAWSTFFSIPLIIKYERMFREILKSLSTYEKNVTIKLHPTQDAVIDVQGIVKEYLPNANIVKNANTYELIAKSDIVITPPSSIITESLILNKPVLLFKFLENDSGIPYEKFNAVLATEKEEEFTEKIKEILTKQKIRNDLKIGRKNFLEYAFDYQGNSSEKIIQIIDEMIKNPKN